jgi:uncharacterized protein YkwD
LAALAWPDRTTTDLHAAGPAMTAGLMFGTYHTVMSKTPTTTGQWPLIMSQLVIVALAAVSVSAPDNPASAAPAPHCP